MADNRLFVQQNTVGRASDGSVVGQRGTRDGSAFVLPWYMGFALEGRVFTANAGSLATPVSAANAAVTNLRPMAVLRVPSGTTIIPIKTTISPRALAGTVNDIIVAFCQNDVGNGTSSAMTVGPINSKTDATVASTVTARQLYTGDCTAPTNPVELLHRCDPYAQSADANGASLNTAINFPESPQDTLPILVGPASWLVYVGATTTGPTFYASFEWVEAPSSYFT